ncbi:hypothetical protein FGG78_30790 [Thioclava sp. BHET1]|nr:hypothetical protein FGG78_30790 [Thioclava sp. BHET1]
MRFIETGRLGIDQGSIVLFSDFANGGPMWVGSGERESRRLIRFDAAFESPPAVMLGIALWDFDNSSNLRGDLKAETVTADGFALVFRTWEDTRVARLRIDWTAIGSLRDPERWRVD